MYADRCIVVYEQVIEHTCTAVRSNTYHIVAYEYTYIASVSRHMYTSV